MLFQRDNYTMANKLSTRYSFLSHLCHVETKTVTNKVELQEDNCHFVKTYLEKYAKTKAGLPGEYLSVRFHLSDKRPFFSGIYCLFYIIFVCLENIPVFMHHRWSLWQQLGTTDQSRGTWSRSSGFPSCLCRLHALWLSTITQLLCHLSKFILFKKYNTWHLLFIMSKYNPKNSSDMFSLTFTTITLQEKNLCLGVSQAWVQVLLLALPPTR